MKVLHVTPTFFPSIGGIETVVRDLALHLRHTGIIADVLHISPDNKEHHQERVDDSVVWRAPLFPNRLVGVTGIRSLLMNYDLIHVHDPQAMALSANVLIQGRGKKKVLSTHGGYFHTANYLLTKKIHWQLVAGAILKQYDNVLASSAADLEIFKSKVPHIKLVANGVNVSKFASVARVAALPTRWIYWGRLAQNKRLNLLVNTVKQARDAGLDINLTIAGRDFDGLLPSIRTRIANCGLDHHIRILAGSLSDSELLAELSAHTVFITASEHEGFGLSVIEAMASGLIVLCRNIAPLNAFVTPGKNGALINFDSSAADLASLLALCKATVAEISAMQRFARLTALSYSWDTAIKHFIDVYEALMGRQMRPSHANPTSEAGAVDGK
jgi:alpha-1,3-mannosyltransferase